MTQMESKGFKWVQMGKDEWSTIDSNVSKWVQVSLNGLNRSGWVQMGLKHSGHTLCTPREHLDLENTLRTLSEHPENTQRTLTSLAERTHVVQSRDILLLFNSILSPTSFPLSFLIILHLYVFRCR